MNYYKFYSADYDEEHEKVTILISMDKEHWTSIMDLSNLGNFKISDEEIEELLLEQGYECVFPKYNPAHAKEWMEKHPNGYYNSEDDYGENSN